MRLAACTFVVLSLASGRARADACADPRLSEAAASVLVSRETPSEAALADAARASGSNAVALRMVRAQVGAESLDASRAESANAEGAFLVCGEAEAGGVVVRITGREGARLVTALTGEGRVIDVDLVDPRSRATLELRANDGTSFRRPLDRQHSRVPLPDGFPTPFVAQVLSDAPGGPRPIATMVHGGLPSVESTDDDIDVHVARLRRLAEVAELRPNAILTRVARDHAATVCRDGQASHVTRAGDPVARVRRAGLDARAIGEVVSRATDVRAAIAGLDASPSHRLELEDRDYTDYGAAVATGADGHVCVVVELAAWPRFTGH